MIHRKARSHAIPFDNQDVLSGDWGPAKQIIDTVAAIENLLIAPSTGIAPVTLCLSVSIFKTLLTNAQRAADGGPLNPTAADFFKTNDEAAIKKKQEAYRTANAGSIATAASAFKSATPFPAFVASSS